MSGFISDLNLYQLLNICKATLCNESVIEDCLLFTSNIKLSVTYTQALGVPAS